MNKRSRFFQKAKRNKSVVAGSFILLCLVIVVTVGPYLPLPNAYNVNTQEMHAPPSAKHLFGTDGFGRDVLSRVILGFRISIIIGCVVVSIRLLIGVTLGLLAGYFGSWIETVIMRMTDIFLSIPTLLLAMVVMATLGKGFTNLVIALSLKGWTSFTRITRSEVLTLKEQDFVEASRAVGSSNLRLMLKHIMPNFASTLLVYSSMNMAYPILGETLLSFLGMGLNPPTISLGYMLSLDRAYLTSAWWASVFPGLGILVLVLGLNLLGDGLRDVLDPTFTHFGG